MHGPMKVKFIKEMYLDKHLYCYGLFHCTVVSVADPMRNVFWMFFPGGTELGTQVKTGGRADRTHPQ